MDSEKRSHSRHIATDRKLRLKLIIAFNGDVVKATTALAFVNDNPEASEEYRRFKEWEMERFRQYCQDKGISIGPAISPEEPSAQ